MLNRWDQRRLRVVPRRQITTLGICDYVSNLAQAVVDFLSSAKNGDPHDSLERFAERDWRRILPWLHDTGLALYFLRELSNAHAIDMVPPAVTHSLETSLRANSRRVRRIAGQFDVLNRKFDDAGILYAAVKGLALIPDFCPDADLRHQSDFDYVILHSSLPQVRGVLEDSGYSLVSSTLSDYVFSLPAGEFKPTLQDQYNPAAPCPVELHLSLWDTNARDILLAQPEFAIEQTTRRTWQRLTFAGLNDETQFLFQITHLFSHISNYWIRLSWLFEISYFLRCRATDAAFWAKVERMISGNPMLQEVVTIVAVLAKAFFETPLPLLLQDRKLRPPVRVWIDKYARAWAFGSNQLHNFNFWPTAKLTLFLLQQFAADPTQFIASRLFPSTRLARVAQDVNRNPRRILDKQFRGRERLLTRTAFHLTGNLRYLFEQPRWLYLNRAAARSPMS